MLSALEFKKQIGKTLSSQFRILGFKGSGFRYLMESEYFVYVIDIQASLYGGQCCVEFGIQPLVLNSFGNVQIDFKKIKHNECEFRERLQRSDGEQWWQYSDDIESNILTAYDIIENVKTNVLPKINEFNTNYKIFESIEISDLDNIYLKVSKKLAGMHFMTTDVRLAWALTRIFEVSNLPKAREFATYGLSKLDAGSKFFGRQDFERVLKCSNGA
jgi:hypothetical protein